MRPYQLPPVARAPSSFTSAYVVLWSLDIETPLLFLRDALSLDKPAAAVLLHAVDERARVGASRYRHQRARVEQPQSCRTCTPRQARKRGAPQQREHPHGGLCGKDSEFHALSVCMYPTSANMCGQIVGKYIRETEKARRARYGAVSSEVRKHYVGADSRSFGLISMHDDKFGFATRDTDLHGINMVTDGLREAPASWFRW